MENPTVADRLRTLKPHHLLVTVEGEDEPRKLAVSNVRNRWQRIDTVLAQLRWTLIDARDKSGATLGLLRAEEDDASPVATPSSGGAGVTIRERELVELTMAAYDRGARAAQESADRALGRAEKSLVLVSDSIAAQLEVMSQATRAVVGQYSEALTLQRTLTAGAAPAPDDAGADMLPALLGMMARGQVAPPKVAPKNGAPEKTAKR